MRFWVFFCVDFLVFWLGFYVIAVGFFWVSSMIYKGQFDSVYKDFVVEFLGNLLGCLGVFCELLGRRW